jgi:lysozyme family protein
MAAPGLTPELRAEYERLFETCEVRPERVQAVGRWLTKIGEARPRYESVGTPLGVPWFFIAVVHCLEASLRFDTHLHNGDPLTARTVHHPPNRPRDGSPPFEWEFSAKDALVGQGLDRWQDWSLAGLLYRLEAYNGFGYRKHHPEVLTPYLWSFSQHYSAGKYVQDGVWSPTAVSQQCGAAVLLRALIEKKKVGVLEATAARAVARAALEATKEPPPAQALGPAVASAVAASAVAARKSRAVGRVRKPAVAARARKPKVVASKARAGSRIRFYAGGPPSEDVRRLQVFLNELGGFRLVLDGKAGRHTSNAARSVLGHYLLGDPRA